MCRNQSEVTAVLNDMGDDASGEEEDLDDQAFEEGIPNLARLRLAVNYNQKRVSLPEAARGGGEGASTRAQGAGAPWGGSPDQAGPRRCWQGLA